MTQRDLVNNFYAALFAYRKGTHETDVAAAGALGIDKNVLGRAREAERDARAHRRPVKYPKPHRKLLRACAKNGDANLGSAAEELLAFIEAARLGRPPGEFSFLYAGMQLLLGEFDGLVRHAVGTVADRDTLEGLAATGLLTVFARGNYLWARGRYASLGLDAAVPLILQGESECAEAAWHMLAIAPNEPSTVFRLLNAYTCNEVPGLRAEVTLSRIEIARLILGIYACLYSAAQASNTFVSDGNEKAELKQRPLYKVAVEMGNLLHQSDIELRVAVQQALEVLKDHDLGEAQEIVAHINSIARCATGNESLSWMSTGVRVYLNHEGARVDRLRRDGTLASRAYPRQFTRLENVEPGEGASHCLIWDRKVCDAHPIDNPLEPPFDKIVAVAVPKLNSWKPGDPH
jgi:hypothetical protein